MRNPTTGAAACCARAAIGHAAAWLNLFNMLPVPPLDGASAITGVLPERAAELVRAVNALPAVSMLGLLIAWQLFPEFARPLFAALLRLVHPEDIYF